jgi:mycothiol S-conjugate amidase
MGEPWQPLKLYYSHGFSKGRVRAIHEAMEAAGLESPYAEWVKNWDDESVASRPDPGTRVTTRVECADYFEVRDAALKAHATQIDPTSRWFAVPLDLQRQVWPTEDYELVRSLVGPIEFGATPEDDLFAGIRERVNA